MMCSRASNIMGTVVSHVVSLQPSQLTGRATSPCLAFSGNARGLKEAIDYADMVAPHSRTAFTMTNQCLVLATHVCSIFARLCVGFRPPHLHVNFSAALDSL